MLARLDQVTIAICEGCGLEQSTPPWNALAAAGVYAWPCTVCGSLSARYSPRHAETLAELRTRLTV